MYGSIAFDARVDALFQCTTRVQTKMSKSDLEPEFVDAYRRIDGLRFGSTEACRSHDACV